MIEYQQEAAKTRQPSCDLTYLLGKLQIEAGEAFQIWLKHVYHNKPMDRAALIDELSDVFWYLANSADLLGVTLSDIASTNIHKLRARHGDSYNAAHYTGGQ